MLGDNVSNKVYKDMLAADYFIAIAQLTSMKNVVKELCHSFTPDGDPIFLLFPAVLYLHVQD